MTGTSGDLSAAATAAATARDLARARGRELLAAPPWAGLEDRVTLVVTAPAAGIEGAPPALALWLAIDAGAARALPTEYQPLIAHEVLVQRQRATASTPAIVVTVTTDTAVERLLQSLTPRALEARWQWRHADVVIDRLRRAEQFALRAGMLPDDGPERILRPLWSAAHAAARALDALTGERRRDALAAAGEVEAALARIACAIDEGAYPPADMLVQVARETRIGRRIGPWLDDLVPALAGDEAATRRVLGSREQALAEVEAVLAERFRGRPWLADPESFALRTPR
jgi:hypothetical protein